MNWMLLPALVVFTGGCFAKKQVESESSSVAKDVDRPHINVMAPLVIGDPSHLDAPASLIAWKTFREELTAVKELGAYGISTDVWWGIVEPEDNKFYWAYYDRVASEVKKSGLKWIPILSTHQCGGNVGDDCDVPIPDWLWKKYSDERNPPRNLQYVSEQGHASREVLSAWATVKVMPDYRDLYAEFQNHFADYRDIIAEITVSLGPSGELRYPAYNSHDQGSGYPTRGAFQSFSPTAIESWKEYAQKQKNKFRTPGGGLPPLSVQKWIDSGQYKNAVGKLYIEWYQWSLLQHGRLLMQNAVDVFQRSGAPLSGVDIGAKIPGVHWRIGSQSAGKVEFGDRLAEISSGLINADELPWGQDGMGRGYREIVAMFADLSRASGAGTVVLHFTALEMADGQDRPEVLSMPASLAHWVGAEAKRQGLAVKGENALAGNLQDPAAWKRMASHLMSPEQPNGFYQGLTILRMSDVLARPEARAAFEALTTGKSPDLPSAGLK